ncbi:hypothetical protein, partial [Rhodoplanes sp. SY1]|uniref:hypothetical protein n=1 Tax=Rhodoplanes sp. SY1 TaxID=3166646 RepID=UPI0038B58EB6
MIIGASAASLPDDFDTTYNQSVYAADGRVIAKGRALPATNPTGVPTEVGSANFRSTSRYQTLLSADRLSGYGLSALSITSNDLVVTADSSLRLAAGGAFSATTGGAIDIAGTVAAAGGKIKLLNDGWAASVGQKLAISPLFRVSVTKS